MLKIYVLEKYVMMMIFLIIIKHVKIQVGRGGGLARTPLCRRRWLRRWRRRRYEVGRASGLGAAGSTAGGDDDDTDAGVAAARCSTIAGSEQPKLGAAPPPRSLAS